nr:restriction endonuclease [Marseillevirus futianmevirus]
MEGLDLENLGKETMNCENRKRGKLCGREECKHCFERSFASCDKSKYLAEGQENPLLIARCSTKKLKFSCPKCSHVFDGVPSCVSNGQFCPFCSNQKLCSSEECRKCFEKSFASHEKAKFWNVEKNGSVPRQVFQRSNKKYWFGCEKCKHFFITTLSSVSNGSFCPYCSSKQLCSSKDCKICFEKSFASHEKAKFWDFEKNTKTPRDVTVSSSGKYWLKCEKCVHSFQATLARTNNGQFCPYCSSKQLCSSKDCKICFEKSFASHEKAKFWDFEKNGEAPIEVFGSSNRKFWFKCEDCSHSFEKTLGHIQRGSFCPYCSNRKLCSSADCRFCFEKSFARHEKAKFWNFEKNNTGPERVFSKSAKKFSFVCRQGHEFFCAIHHVSNGKWCPLCKNKTEAKLLKFLQGHFKDPIHQFKVSWCKNPETDKFLPFDFCISKTIVELDGRQHYEQVSNWQSPELTQKSDRYKEEQAVKNGYSVLRILQEDVWDDKIDWKKLLLEHIKDYDEPIVKNLWDEVSTTPS